jgi:RNA polymerase sigma factor (sigma-70 family)
VTLDESALAIRAAQDSAAFGELYDHFFPRVFNYTRYRCDDDLTADDLTAHIFERALTCLDQYTPEKGPFAPWLFALARNVVTDYWRRARRHRWVSLDFLRSVASPDPDPEARLVESEAERELLVALEGLDPRERDILGLKFAARLNNRQIAKTTGLSENNVGVTIYRAVGKLRERLTEVER